MTARLIHGDVLAGLRSLDAGSVRCVVTSPPYWGLRDYGIDGQLGLEQTADAYVAALVGVFREVRRVLADDGTVWLNLGDSYAAGKNTGMASKQLVGIPWRVAFALQADGWWLRQDIIWHKPNPMPESVRDRCTKAHEYVFLMAKSERYYFDSDAIADTANVPWNAHRGFGTRRRKSRELSASDLNRHRTQYAHNSHHDDCDKTSCNRRSVWSISPQPYRGAHFAVMPEELARICILAGSRSGDTVLDPFCGSGTTGAVALGNGRGFVGIDINRKYLDLAVARIGPMLTTVEDVGPGRTPADAQPETKEADGG